MTVNNIFVKYPELKEIFNVNKGFFKGFSVVFSSVTVSTVTKTSSAINGIVVWKRVSNSADAKDKVIKNYVNHCALLLTANGVSLTEDILNFVEETSEEVWRYNKPKFIKAENVTKTKLEFDNVRIKRNGRTTKFVDKYGDVRGIVVRESVIKGVLSFGAFDYGRWVAGYLGNSNDLEEVVRNFLGYRTLNECQIAYLRDWLNKVTIGV